MKWMVLTCTKDQQIKLLSHWYPITFTYPIFLAMIVYIYNKSKHWNTTSLTWWCCSETPSWKQVAWNLGYVFFWFCFSFGAMKLLFLAYSQTRAVVKQWRLLDKFWRLVLKDRVEVISSPSDWVPVDLIHAITSAWLQTLQSLTNVSKGERSINKYFVK